jgi:hypothetical protein
MMDQLIEIWQSTGTDQGKMDRKYSAEDLMPQIIKLEKNQKKVLSFKTYTVLSLVFVFMLVFFAQSTLSLTGCLGIGIVTVSILVSVLIFNSLRFRISDEERTFSMLKLLDVTAKKLKTERKIFTIYLPLFLLIIIFGLNLFYVDYFIDLEIRLRILYHLIITAGLIVAFVLGLLVRIRRFNKRFLPLLTRIMKFKKTMSN